MKRMPAIALVVVIMVLAGCTFVIQPESGSTIITPSESASAEVEVTPEGIEEAAMNPLAGTTWQWLRTEYSDDSVVEAADPSRYTLTFNADGSLAARVDCNRGMGSYTADDVSLTLGPLATTRMMCPPDSQDSEFTKHLDGVVSYLIEDGLLHLALRYDTGIMVFAPVE